MRAGKEDARRQKGIQGIETARETTVGEKRI